MPRRNVNVTNRILHALKQGRLTWPELLEHTKVSRGSLSKYLKRLLKVDWVEIEVDGTTKRKTTYYKKSMNFGRRQKMWQELLSRYPESWRQELGQTHMFLDLILRLDIQEMQSLRSLLNKFIKLEEMERKERERKNEIVDEEDKVILRNKETGEIVATINLGFPKSNELSS